MQIEIPKNVERLVTEKANRAGFENVSEYVMNLVLGDHRSQQTTSGAQQVSWSDELNSRRCELIDKDIQGLITVDEQLELEGLTEQLRQFRRHNSPLPIEGAILRHAELLEKKRQHDEHRIG